MASVSLLFVSALFAVSSEGFLFDKPTAAAVTPWHLTYFNFRGRGEVSRLVFAAASMNYTETQVTFTQWPALKPTMPYRTMPILNVSGEIYAQSLAIQAFIARETGLYPTNNRDALMVDQIAMAREDLYGAQSKYYIATDPAIKAAALAEVEGYLPLFLGNTAGYMRQNTKSGWVVGDKMTLGDIILYEGTQSLIQRVPTALDAYPELKALRTKVETDGPDSLKQYLAARRVVMF